MKLYRKFVIFNTKIIFGNEEDETAFKKKRRNLLINNVNGDLKTKNMIEDLLMYGVELSRRNREIFRLNEIVSNLYSNSFNKIDYHEMEKINKENVSLRKQVDLNKESFVYKNDRIKMLNEIVENDKEIITKLNKELRILKNINKQDGLIKHDTLPNENFVFQSKDECINKRFEILKEFDSDKLVKAFNLKSIKSFEQLENENKSLRGQIKKQASEIKNLKNIKTKSRVEENKTNAYVEKLVDKNRSLNEKLSNQSDTIEYLMRFKKLYNDGIFVKTSPEQVGIVTIAQDGLNNLICENEDMKKTIHELHKSNNDLKDFKKKLVDAFRKNGDRYSTNVNLLNIVLKEIKGEL